MKKILISIPILFFLTLSVFSEGVVFASTCNQVGNTTYCSDGSTYTQVGNTVYGPNGSTYTQVGNTTYGPSGSTYTQVGNTTYGSNGSTYTQVGNTTYGPNGSTYTQVGNTNYGSGNSFNTCPANSSYDSSTSKCSCNYGYSVNSSKTSCIYTGTTYTAPATPTCPLNSYDDGTSSCKCNYGYAVSGNSCVAITQICQNKYGYNSYGSGTSCYCSTGYQWNSSQTSCVAIPTQPSSVAPAIPPPSTGSSCSNFGAGAELRGNLCYCSKYYKWNSAISSCQIGNPFFTRYLDIGSTGADVVNLKNFLAIQGLYTGYVSSAYDGDTAIAVRVWQAVHNISPTGTVGPQTRAALNKFINGGY